MNRFIAFSCLLAVVAAEAEPWLGYAGLYGHGLGYGYGGLLHKPVITSVGALTTYSNGAVTPTNTPAVQIATANHLAAKAGVYAAHGYGVPYLHSIGKREAEADPWYGVYGGYGGVYGGYGYAPVTHPVTSVGALTTYANGAVVPTDPANLAATHAHLASKGLHYLGKREAEAESEPWLGYAGLYGHGLGYGYGGYAGLHPYTAGFGCHNVAGAPVPCAGRKKRSAEAEAEADPYFYYPAYPHQTSVGALTTYSNGAVVPTDLANQAATAAHLATTYPRPAYGYAGYGYGLGLWG